MIRLMIELSRGRFARKLAEAVGDREGGMLYPSERIFEALEWILRGRFFKKEAPGYGYGPPRGHQHRLLLDVNCAD